MLSGVKVYSQSLQSHHLVQITGPKGRVATIKPSVLPVPLVLWGRDVLTQWGVFMKSNFALGSLECAASSN